MSCDNNCNVIKPIPFKPLPKCPPPPPCGSPWDYRGHSYGIKIDTEFGDCILTENGNHIITE